MSAWKLTGGLAGRKQRDTVTIAQSVLDHVMSHGPLPFELRVLEALLDGTTRHFQARRHHQGFLRGGCRAGVSQGCRGGGCAHLLK